MRGRLLTALLATGALALSGVPGVGAAAQGDGSRGGDGAAWLEARRGAAQPGSAAAWSSPDGGGAAPVAPASVRPLRDRPEGAARDAGEWRRAWEQAGGELRAAGDLATWLAASDVAFAQAEPADPGAGLGFIQQVTPAGDLDGDGADDVLAAGRLYDVEAATAHALSGRDGHELWRVEAVGDQLPTLVPLGASGGVLDVTHLRGESVFEGRCDAEGTCEETRTSAFAWRLAVRDPATGAPLWERTYEGSDVATFTTGEQAGEYFFSQVSDSTDGSLVSLPGPDLDGDGRPEILVSRGDVHREYEERYSDGFEAPGGGYSHAESVRATIVAEALSGASGEPVFTRVIPDVPATGILRGAGDTDGDGADDLLIEQRTQPDFAQTCGSGPSTSSCDVTGEPPRLEIELLDGTTFEPVWRAVAPDTQDVTLEGVRADFDGDGGSDLLLTERRYDRPESALTAIAGASGAILWRHASTGSLVPIAVAFLDGDADADVLAGLFPNFGFGPVTPTVTVERLDGTTGAVLLSTTHHATDFDPQQDWGYADLTSPGDGDGDGAADAAVAIEVYDGETGEERRELVLESALTGAPIFRRAGAGALRQAGDLDGDGGDDAVSFVVDPPTGVVVLEALRLRDGSTIWVGRGSQHGGPPVPAGDLDGDGAADLVQLDVDYGAFPIGRVVSLDGQDGQERWSFPPLRAVTVDRIAGDDRVATAVAVSQAVFSTAPAAVLARADDYPDALAGGPLAAVLDGPLLLTGRDRLDARVGAELERLAVERVVLLGGAGALDPAVEQDLATLGIAVERVAGADRFDTAGLVADRVVAATGFADEVLLVQGSDPDPARGWPDAVSASAFGATFRQPVLLTETHALPAATGAALDRLRPQYVRIVGGAPAVADSVVTELGARGIYAERLAGDNRFATARIVATAATQFGATPSAVWVATGRAFPDALAAGAAVGATRGVLLLVDGPEGTGAGDAGAYLDHLRAHLLNVHLIGGPDVVAPEIEEFIRLVTAIP